MKLNANADTQLLFFKSSAEVSHTEAWSPLSRPPPAEPVSPELQPPSRPAKRPRGSGLLPFGGAPREGGPDCWICTKTAHRTQRVRIEHQQSTQTKKKCYKKRARADTAVYVFLSGIALPTGVHTGCRDDRRMGCWHASTVVPKVLVAFSYDSCWTWQGQ